MSSRERARAEQRRRKAQGSASDLPAPMPAAPLPDGGGPLGEDLAARPLPLIGVSWLERGEEYRRKRRRAVLLYVGCLVLAVVATGLWESALASGVSSGPGKVAVVLVYLVPAVPAYLLGRRHLARYGLESRRRRIRSGAAGLFGVVAFVVTPIALGVCIACLQGVLEYWFPGEAAARQAVLHRRTAQRPVLH